MSNLGLRALGLIGLCICSWGKTVRADDWGGFGGYGSFGSSTSIFDSYGSYGSSFGSSSSIFDSYGSYGSSYDYGGSSYGSYDYTYGSSNYGLYGVTTNFTDSMGFVSYLGTPTYTDYSLTTSYGSTNYGSTNLFGNTGFGNTGFGNNNIFGSIYDPTGFASIHDPLGLNNTYGFYNPYGFNFSGVSDSDESTSTFVGPPLSDGSYTTSGNTGSTFVGPPFPGGDTLTGGNTLEVGDLASDLDFNPNGNFKGSSVDIDKVALAKFTLGTAEGRATLISANLMLVAVAIEQHKITPEKLAAATEWLKGQITELFSEELASPDDLEFLRKNGDSYIATLNELNAFQRNGYQGLVKMPAIDLAVSDIGIYVKEADNSFSRYNFDWEKNKVSVTKQGDLGDMITWDYKLSDFMKLPSMKKFADEDVVDMGGEAAGAPSTSALYAATIAYNSDALRQWTTSVGPDLVGTALASNPVQVQAVIDGTQLWNGVVGVENVDRAIASDAGQAAKVAAGTATAIEIYGSEAVENAIRTNGDIAVQGAEAIAAAKEAGYDNATIEQYIAAHPDDWWTWGH